MNPIYGSRPILFLDIDGVLNSLAYAKARDPGLRIGIDPEAVKHLQLVVDETDCAIVLSSTWRLLYGLAEMRGRLAAAGLREPVPLYDRTPDLTTAYRTGSAVVKSPGRGAEINAWLSEKDYDGRPWCAIDDDTDFLPGQPLVRTTFADGMQEEHALECIQYLTRSLERAQR